MTPFPIMTNLSPLRQTPSWPQDPKRCHDQQEATSTVIIHLALSCLPVRPSWPLDFMVRLFWGVAFSGASEMPERAEMLMESGRCLTVAREKQTCGALIVRDGDIN